MPLLTVDRLTTVFHTEDGTARAVDDVSFSIQEGETLGIVGESGSGKSVTSLSILRLVPEPPGEILAGSSIRFRERELLQLDETAIRDVRGNDIAMIFQEPMTSLNPVHTIGSQVAEAIRRHRGADRREAWNRAVEMLELVGIPAAARRANDYPHELSGGQRQRVMIAMALSCDPDLLIADEPTTALDVTIQAQILELLTAMRARFGMALILITHDLGIVTGMCDRVAVMYGGRIVEEGPVDVTFRDPRHPYTEGLLSAIPTIDRQRDVLPVIPGQVPNATRWPAGCRFHPRCRYAWDRCRTEEPGLIEAGDGRRSRCWLEQEPSRRADASPPGTARLPVDRPDGRPES